MLEGYQPIGIIATPGVVVETLLHSFVVCKIRVSGNQTFYRGKLLNREAVLVQSGIGKVNAAICSALLCEIFAVKSIIVLGFAGALVKRLHQGDLIIAEDVIQHDLDFTRLGLPPGRLPGLPYRAFPADPRLVALALEAAQPLPGVHAHKGRLLTGDQSVSGSKQINLLRDLFNGKGIDTEGAAIAQVCAVNKVPFVLIHCIAQRCNGKFAHNSRHFFKLAADNLAFVLREMISGMVVDLPKL